MDRNERHSAAPEDRTLNHPNTGRASLSSSTTRGLAWGAIFTWMLVALLVSLTEIHDRDFGFHLAWGRLLREDFGSVAGLTLGQDPSSTVYAYSYWLYQTTVAFLFDNSGPIGVVLLRALTVIATLAVGRWIAGRMGAPPWAQALGLTAGILVSHERFVDRPDLVSHLLWMVALAVLVLQRNGRGVFWLLPIQALWVNVHLYFGLLPILYLAFLVGDAWERKLNARRAAFLLAGLVLASFLNPLGPAVWRSQLAMVQFVGASSVPFPIVEMQSPFSKQNGFLALWAFRLVMPATLLLALSFRRRLGYGPLLGLLMAAALGAVATRMMSLFGVTAVAFLPLLVTTPLPGDSNGRIPRPPRRVRSTLAPAGVALVGLLGILGVIGLVNGRIYLAQDKSLAIDPRNAPHFPAARAAHFLHATQTKGPLFHNPTSAGAILMEDGVRLTPFLDPRWVGTPDAMAAYDELRHASGETVAELWRNLDQIRGFQAVMLDFYEMPALLRHLYANPEWSLVSLDPGAAVFCRRGGANQETIGKHEDEVIGRFAEASPEREAELAREVLLYLSSPTPGPWKRLSFPFSSFHLANFALQIHHRPEAQRHYLELLRNQKGALHVSRHQGEILGNLLWCLEGSAQWEAIEALCADRLGSQEGDPTRRRGLRIQRAGALFRLGRGAEAATLADDVRTDPGASAAEIGWAWSMLASERQRAQDYEGAVEAWLEVVGALPESPDGYRAIGILYDLRLARTSEALDAYDRYVALGGTDSAVLERILVLRGQSEPGDRSLEGSGTEGSDSGQ